MAKITFPVATTTNSLSTFNANFVTLAAELQNKVLYRDNPDGETNTVLNDLDLDGNDVFNVGRLDAEDIYMDGVRIDQIVGDTGAAKEFADAAALSAAQAASSASAAATSASNASSSAASAVVSANAAQTSATNAANSATTAASAGAAAGAAAGSSAAGAFDTALRADLASHVFGKGAGMSGYRFAGSGLASTTNLQGKLDYVLWANDYGFSPAASGAANLIALQNAINQSAVFGGWPIRIRAGTYNITGALYVGYHNLKIIGDGMESTILVQTADSVTFSTGVATQYQTFSDFTLRHAVTQTGDAFFFQFSRASFFERIKLQNHANGFNFYGFEQTELRSLHIVAPSNQGIAIICGHAAAPGTNTGANLIIDSCFLRGNDYLVGGAIIGNTYGIVGYDVEAIWMVNVDISNMDVSSMVLSPTWRMANCYFTQCFFDGTKNGHNVLITGAGVKHNFTFTGSWICSAGMANFGGLGVSRFQKHGLFVADGGGCTDWTISATRFYNNQGNGFYTENTQPDIVFDGCSFFSNGIDPANAPYRYGAHMSPVGVAALGCQFTGNRFRGNGVASIREEATVRGTSAVGNYCEGGISTAGGATHSSAFGLNA